MDKLKKIICRLTPKAENNEKCGRCMYDTLCPETHKEILKQYISYEDVMKVIDNKLLGIVVTKDGDMLICKAQELKQAIAKLRG